MTRMTNARIAGFTFLFYIAAGVPSMILFGRATRGDTIAAQLASLAQHVTDVRLDTLLSLAMCFSALVLGVTLYAITRDQDRDLATLALVCRVGEGLVGIGTPVALAVLWLATATGPDAPDPGTARALATFLFKLGGWKTLICATLFAVGSTLFSWLMLRGRMIPAPLAGLGVLASLLLVVGLPLRLAGFLDATVAGYMWIPMAAFEIPLAFWLLIRGVAPPVPAAVAARRS